MERRIAGAVTAGSMAGAVAGSAVAGAGNKTRTSASRGNRSNQSMSSRAGSAVGAVLDTKQGQGQGNGCQGEYQGYADPDRLCPALR